jgi:uncharacterized membrane protein
VALGITAALLAGLLGWQYSNSPSLERSSLEQQATATVQRLVQNQEDLNYLDADIRYTQSSDTDTNTLLAVVYVQAQPDNPLAPETIQENLSADLEKELIRL